MREISITEAGSRLAELIREAKTGQEVVITENERPVARLVALRANAPRRAGSARGRVRLSDDFDAPLEGWEAYQP
jgi:prevent-host-death family protein